MESKASKIRTRSSRFIQRLIPSRSRPHSSSEKLLGNYMYTPLSEPKAQIRLLTLFPSEDPLAEIRCHLEVVSATTSPAYEALSYAWGDPQQTHLVVMNDRRALVTESLHSALLHLRLPDRPRKMWIDALCIDQGTDSEKSHQVKQMGQIYSRASNVVIWLGPGSDDLDLALRAAPRLEKLVEILEWIDIDKGRLYLNNADVRPRLDDYLQSQMEDSILSPIGSGADAQLAVRPHSLRGSPIERLINDIFGTYGTQRESQDVVVDLETIIGEGVWAALQNLYQRSWWGRLWVIQEFILARNVSFMCGSQISDITQIERLTSNFLRLDGHWISSLVSSPPEVANDRADNIFRLRQERHFSVDPDTTFRFLPILIDAVSGTACSDPRDKIFAVSGLSNEDFVRLIEPDYSIPVVDVYLNFAWTWINNKQNLDILNCCDPFRGETYALGLPTWVPDWVYHANTPLILHSLEDGCQMFTASWGAPFTGVQDSSSRKSEILRAEGFCFDIVAKANPPLYSGEDNAPAEILKLWRSRPEINSDPLKFWMTLAMERGDALDRLEDVELEQFQEHVRRLHSLDLSVEEWAKSPDFRTAYKLVSELHSFFTTTSGLMGNGTESTQVGDLVCVLFGGQTPFLLRRVESPNESGQERYTFVGECYVNGVMDGEAMDQLEEGKYTRQVFEIE